MNFFGMLDKTTGSEMRASLDIFYFVRDACGRWPEAGDWL